MSPSSKRVFRKQTSQTKIFADYLAAQLPIVKHIQFGLLCYIVLNPISAHKYDQKAIKVGIPILENILFFCPFTSRAPKRGTQLFSTLNIILTCKKWQDLNIQTILIVISTCIKRGSLAQMIAYEYIIYIEYQDII